MALAWACQMQDFGSGACGTVPRARGAASQRTGCLSAGNSDEASLRKLTRLGAGAREPAEPPSGGQGGRGRGGERSCTGADEVTSLDTVPCRASRACSTTGERPGARSARRTHSGSRASTPGAGSCLPRGPGRGAPMLTAQSRAARTRPEAKCPRGVTGNTLHSPLSEAGKIGDVLTHETLKWTCFSVVGVDPPGGRPAPPRGRGAPDGHTHGAFRGQRPHQQRQTPAEHYRSRPVVAKAPRARGVG